MAHNTGNPIGSQDVRDLIDNAENLDRAVNDRSNGSWVDRCGVVRPTLHAVETAVPEALQARDQSVLARDAALAATGPWYETESAGRAAVSDGETFKVLGSGDVAAYAYRRINATTSTLITEYPSLDGAKNQGFPQRGIFSGTLLSEAVKQGTYWIDSLSGVTDIPSGAPAFLGNFCLENVKLDPAGSHVKQLLSHFSEQFPTWVRRVNTATGVKSEWVVTDSSGAAGVLTSADDLNASSVNALVGSWVYSSKPLNAPADAPASGIYRGYRAGVFLTQEIISTAATESLWRRTIRPATGVYSAWSKVNLNGDYELAVVSSGSLRDYRGIGAYFISAGSTVTDGPAKMNKSVEHKLVNEKATKDGTEIRQTVTDSENPKLSWSRRLQITPTTIISPWIPVDSSSSQPTLTSADDLNSLDVSGLLGTAVYTSKPLNAPADAPASGIFTCSQAGSFYSQKITPTNDLTQQWVRVVRPNAGVFGVWTKVILPSTGGGSSTSPALGKRWVFFGDSITEFGTYPELVGIHLGLQVIKAGFGGCRMANHSQAIYDPMSMYRMSACVASGDFTDLIDGAQALFEFNADDNRAQAAAVANANWPSVDGTVIFFGTNDFGGSVPIGTKSDTGGTTFKGALNTTITNLLTAYPKLNLLFVTPIYRSRGPAGEGKDSDDFPDANGAYLRDFSAAIKEIAGMHHIPVFDLGAVSGIGKLTASTMIPDGVHPAVGFGYERIAERISAAIRSTFYA